MSHTPAPWVIVESDDDYLIVNEKSEACSAEAYGIENARLIAAAPDLLEALKALLNAHERSERGHAYGVEIRFAITEQARAAIAKAEG